MEVSALPCSTVCRLPGVVVVVGGGGSHVTPSE